MTDLYSDLEQKLIRELDEIASRVDVPTLPELPATTPGRGRWASVGPVIVAAVALVAVMATIGALLLLGGDGGEEPAPTPSTTVEDDTLSDAVPDGPAVIGSRLYVGGRQVSGLWYSVQGTAGGWTGQRADGTWWWGSGAQPQPIESTVLQGVEISPDGSFHAEVVDQDGAPALVGADTEFGGEGFGASLPGGSDPAPRVTAVTDDGLVVVLGSTFHRMARPLVDGELVDLATTAPGQVVIGNTDAGLIVTEGDYASADGTQGAPYLARIGEDGTLTRLASLPTHDVLEASADWLAYVPPGTVGGEASGTGELQVQQVGGGAPGVLTPPDGWLFVAPGFQWETEDRLLATVVAEDGSEEGLVRCRPEPASCVMVAAP